MSVLYIGKASSIEGFDSIFSVENNNVLFKSSSRFCKIHFTNHSFLLFSHTPVIKKSDYEDITEFSNINFEQVLKTSHNNFASFQVCEVNGQLEVSMASARIGRDRVFVLKNKTELFLSDDIRELIPFSTKTVSKEAIYSVIKFGDTPELSTCIEGVVGVPVGSFWKGSLIDLFSKNTIAISDFQVYQQFHYDFIGGDIGKTETELESMFSFLAKKDVLIPVSGGIDSSLINYMINDYKSEAYPAYYLRFGEDDPEVEFAKKAIKNTKADLNIYEMKNSDFIEAFHHQTEMAKQPIGESSTIALAYFFKQCNIENHLVLDGTLADGCYGSANYMNNIPVPAEKSVLRSRLEEKFASKLQLSRLPGAFKFFPRDSYISDVFMQQLNIYVGPLGNSLFKNVKSMNENLEKNFEYYYDLISTSEDVEVDEWMKYSIFKMANYASKNNTAKSFDNVGTQNEAGYPFMWRKILEDQGHYNWKEKCTEGIIKYPLKKIIERYADKDFIYRKKVGLNSSFEDWVCTNENKSFLKDLLTERNGVPEVMMGKRNLNTLLKHFMSDEQVHPNVSRLVINLAISQSWVKKHGLTVD